MRDKKGRFLKGYKQRLGAKHTEEAKEKMSIVRLGKSRTITWGDKISKSLKGKKRLKMLGKNNPAWKGGISIQRELNRIPHIKKTKTQLLDRKRFRNQRYKAIKKSAFVLILFKSGKC